MNIEIADYVELKDGGAVVTFEMDEEARESLICEAIKSRILAGLEATKTEINLQELSDLGQEQEGENFYEFKLGDVEDPHLYSELHISDWAEKNEVKATQYELFPEPTWGGYNVKVKYESFNR